MRNNNVMRERATARPQLFIAAVLATVAAHPGITETDLMTTLRGNWLRAQYDPPSFVCWSFGLLDFRHTVTALVRAKALAETRSPRNNKTTYALADASQAAAVFAAWKELLDHA
jgi:hypothetical protein